jgi:hypothetical protein
MSPACRPSGRIASRTAELISAAAEAGLAIHVYTRDIAESGAAEWPAVQIAVGVDLDRLSDWENAQADIKNLMAYEPSETGVRAPVLIIPLIHGRPVRLLARQLIINSWPGAELFDSWADPLPPPHPTPLADAVLDAHAALQTLSGLAVLSTRRETTPEHQMLFDRYANRFGEALETIAGLAHEDAVVAEITDFLDATARRLYNELEEGQPEGDVQQTLAAGIALGATGTATDDFAELDGLVLVSLQWDLDPDAAAELMDS